MDKISRVKDELDEVTSMMRANIGSVVDRGEHLELLMDNTEGLSSQVAAGSPLSILQLHPRIHASIHILARPASVPRLPVAIQPRWPVDRLPRL